MIVATAKPIDAGCQIVEQDTDIMADGPSFHVALYRLGKKLDREPWPPAGTGFDDRFDDCEPAYDITVSGTDER